MLRVVTNSDSIQIRAVKCVRSVDILCVMKTVLILLSAVLVQNPRIAQPVPVPAHKVIGNVYYVGPNDLGSYLITTPEGHILINTDFEATVPLIRANVEKMGFKFTDIKIILASHSHSDHVEGDALVKQLTGAQVMVMEEDVADTWRITPGNKAHPIDRVLNDGAEVKIGGTTLVAHLTPGHTKGCTTWTMQAQEEGKTYNVGILCGVGGVIGRQLVNNRDYPQIAEDYMRSFKILRSLPVDVFLASHSVFYNIGEKIGEVGKGRNPWIDPVGYKAHLDSQEKVFLEELAKQTKRGQ